MGTGTTKHAKVGIILIGSSYVSLRFRNIVPEVHSAVHKQYLVGLLAGNCKVLATKPCSLRVFLCFLRF
jgi:hypothetical protein